ncbi:MAG: hypothetical protein ABIK91_01720 [Pseudomonadota bacterium]
MKTLCRSIALLCLFVSLSYASDDLISHKVISSSYVGCFIEEDLDSFVKYAISKDYGAMQEMMTSVRCFYLKKDAIAYIEDFRVTGKVKLRLRGKTSTFWTVRGAIN